MKIYLSSAERSEASWAAGLGLVDGLLTTPQQLVDAGAVEDPRGLLQDLCRAVPGTVVASVESVRSEEMYRDGRELGRLSDQIAVEVPLVEDGIDAIRRLSTDGVRVVAGLVYSPAQAVLAARAGASMVSCQLQHLDAEGRYGLEVVEEIRSVFDAVGLECDLLVAPATTSSGFSRSALAGADAIAVTPETLRSLLVHPLTDRGVDRFLTMLGRLPKARLGV